jgi:hypothetical protein
MIMKSQCFAASVRPAISTLVVSLAALFASTSPVYAGSLVAKQLNGPPVDFESMRAVDTASAAIYSKSALVPVSLKAGAAGKLSWQGELPMENGRARVLVFSGNDNPWQVDMVAPSGLAKRASGVARDVQRAQFGIDQVRHGADYYTFEGMEKGAWQLKLSAQEGQASEGYVLMEGDPATELASYQTHRRQLVGESVGFTALMVDTLEKRGGAKSTTQSTAPGRIGSASLRVTMPDGIVQTFAMFDDGKHGDGVAGDGVFGGDFPALKAGTYLAQVVMRGTDRDGNAVLRTAEHVVPIVEASLQLASGSAKAARVSGTRLSIDIAATAMKEGQHYRAYGELWGTGADGKAMPVAWVGGMVSPVPGDTSYEERFDLRSPMRERVALRGSNFESAEISNSVISLGFDERWVALSGARAPFELRDLRIEDPDHFVTVASAKRLGVSLPAMSVEKSAVADIAIDEEMTMGPRPAAAKSIAKATGSRLLLIHGYCSGSAPWPPSHFTNASTFLDLNKNRSHDAFAQLIKSFGATWNSFGAVAHSQGGAASLHLYTYYWSGLDNAVGSRLIQSVGTPYQGTNLAGVLAALGSIFGAGCGTQDNLTYSGAASWLAGIPNSNRAKVNYYTTSFKSTNWWTNDYCNFASDLVLSDPEDGTTEQAYGQLPGAVNRGHTTGQCHTTGMRDPAQYQDAGRNATMNTNAAR